MSTRHSDTGTGLLAFLAAHDDVFPEGVLRPGAEVGPWTIEGLLGRGGSAEVYRARRREDGSFGAMKVLVREEESSRKRFAREARLLGMLDLSVFPRLLGSGEVSGRPYLVMELLEPLPLPRGDRAVARYLVAVAKGVAALHRAGYVHRDIKPRNILFRKGDGPVLIDLGLAKDYLKSPLEGGDQLSVVDGKAVGVGTPRYAAPEQFSTGDATPATDIHGLGMLAYDCFEKAPPAAWRKIIRRATSTIPSERFQDVRALLRAIRLRHLPFVVAGGLLLAMGLLVSLALARGGRFFLPSSSSGSSPDAVVAAVRDLPAAFDLGGQEIVWAEPVRLRRGKTYRITGPGLLDANFLAEEGAVLWMTNCVVVNRAGEGYPENPLRYSLTSGVYLNLANQRPLPAARVGDFIETPDGASNDLDRVDLGPSGNDIRFGGPDSRSGLAQDKNTRYYRLHLPRDP